MLYNLVVTGEAASRVPDEAVTAFPRIDWRRIRAMRNILAHEYFRVSLDVIWKTVVDDRPELRVRLEQVLSA